MKKTPVVVLRSNDVCFQGIIRSFGVSDIPSISIIFDWKGSKPWLSEGSKYFNRHFVITNPAENPQKALTELIDIGKSLYAEFNQKLFLIPSSDTNMALIELDPSALEKYFLFIGDKNFQHFRNDAFDKRKTFSTLTEQLPIPQTMSCASIEDIDRIVTEIKYPCIIKPAKKDFSQSFYAKHKGLKAIEANSPESLTRALLSEVKDGLDILVQEKVIFNGPEDEIPFYIYADKNHKIRMAISALKERIDPYPFGTATVLKLNYVEELLEPAQRVADTMKWRGPLMIEFIKDLKDSKWKVIELNGRPWLLIDFFRRAGFPFLKMLYDDHYVDSAFSQELIRPHWEKQDSPIHFELTSLFNIFKFQNVESIKNFIEQYPGRKSFYYFDPTDQKPAELEFATFQPFNESESAYFKYLRGETCEY